MKTKTTLFTSFLFLLLFFNGRNSYAQNDECIYNCEILYFLYTDIFCNDNGFDVVDARDLLETQIAGIKTTFNNDKANCEAIYPSQSQELQDCIAQAKSNADAAIADAQHIYDSTVASIVDITGECFKYYTHWKAQCIYDCNANRIGSSVGEGQRITISPNPSNGQFIATYSASAAGNVIINVYDMAGRVVLQTIREINAGINDVALNIQLPQQMYLLEVREGDTVSQVKFVVEK